MSVTKVISVNEARGLFSQLQVAPPQFPSGLESITMNLFPLQDGSTLGCCEYFNIVFRGTQPLRIQGYDAPKLDMTLICDSDDSDDDIEIISGTIPKPVVPGPVVPMRSLSPPQPAPRQRYKVNQKAIFVGPRKLCSDKDVHETVSLSESTASAMSKEGLGMSMAVQVLNKSDDDDAKKCANNMLYFLRNNFVKDKASGTYAWKQDQYYHDNTVNGYYLQRLTVYVQKFFQRDGPCVDVKSPTYIFGDIHGNYKDLIRLSKMFGMHYNPRSSPAKFLFLGDYVDRGNYSVEVVTYLFAMKILYPNRVFLLRGNHETETVNTTTDNGLYETCIRNYGESDGRIAHSLIQEAFKYLPFCATVDNQIFCVHGGIPRMISERPTCNIMEEIRRIQIPWDNTKEQSYDVVFGNERNKLCYDLLWSDPFPSDMEVVTEGYPKGFAQSTRGHGPVCFDKEVVSNFLRRTGFTHIIRAHEAIDKGVSIKDDGRVFTVFSSSGYNTGSQAGAFLLSDGL